MCTTAIRYRAQSRGVAVCACLVLLALAGGCAAVFRPATPNELWITSEPDSVQVIVDGWVYITPANIELPPAPRYVVEYRKAGYRAVFDTVETSVGTSWLVADIICSLPAFGAPAAIDYLFGQWYVIDKEHERRHVRLTADPAGTQVALPAGMDIHRQPAEGDSVYNTRLIAFRTEPKVHERPALLLETGFSFPVYQTPTIPTSYSAGFSFAPAEWCVVAIRQEAQGIAAGIALPDAQGIPVAVEASLFALSTTTDIRFPLWNSGVYLAGGAGVVHASMSSNQSTIAAGQLPAASVGGGYLFPDSKWFIDVRYTSALSTMRIAPAATDYRPHYTTARFGLRLLF